MNPKIRIQENKIQGLSDGPNLQKQRAWGESEMMIELS